jgi:four helix bundle protein
MRIYELSKSFPQEERYALTSQIRRSSRSVCNNLAEAWRKRRYEAAFVSKLSDSDSEAAETAVSLDFARDCGFISVEEHHTLIDQYDQICRMLVTMMNEASRWCTRKTSYPPL